MNNSNFVYDSLANICRGSSGVEQLIRNQQVVGSNPILGSPKFLILDCFQASDQHHYFFQFLSAHHCRGPVHECICACGGTDSGMVQLPDDNIVGAYRDICVIQDICPLQNNSDGK